MTSAEGQDGAGQAGRAARGKARRGLFAKYTLAFVSLVVFVLTINAAIETWIAYGETMSRVRHVQTERAEDAARRITGFLAEVERQVGWATRASSTTLERRKADYDMLLGEEASIVELTYVDGSGQVRLDVPRPGTPPAPDDDGSPEAPARQSWRGPVYFLGADPFVTVAVAHAGANAGRTVARIALRALSKIVGSNLPSAASDGYVVGQSGQVLAASEAGFAQEDVGRSIRIVAGSGGAPAGGGIGRNARGRFVVTSGAPVEDPGWTVVVAQPALEVLQPVVDLLIRLAWLLALGLIVAILAGLLLARHMTRPIQALHAGAAQFATSRFEHRIAVGTGDEFEDLAGQMNRMADDLASSYGQLELKVDERTRELGQSVRELETVEEIGRAVASSLDLKTVLSVIVTRAVSLTKADAGAIFSYDAQARSFTLAEARGLPPPLVEVAATTPIRADEGWSETDFGGDGLIRVADLGRGERFPLREATLGAGFRAALAAVLQRQDDRLGVLVLYRRDTGDVLSGRAGLMKTLADQSVLAMHNARLFREVADKGVQIEIANTHRTSFFANMSHELRTPLNAVLGYSELLSDGIYGEIPERALGVLDRIQTNGKHLLSLINDVLDITKMEAGALSLALNSYSMQDVVTSVVAAAEPLAAAKRLALLSVVSPGLPLGHGDDRRLVQVLLNLVGNAVKFTDEGSVTIEVSASGGRFHVAVRDTGPGIPAADLQRIFEEFHQVESEVGRKTTGTGLGLSISRRLVAMHGGTIEVASKPGQGSSFTITLPVRTDEQRTAA